MEKHTGSNRLSVLLCAVLIAAMALMTAACGDSQTTEDTASQDSAQTTEVQDSQTAESQDGEATVVGEGETTFSFTVTGPDETVTAYEIHTDAETVGQALEELDLIAGEEGDYGLFVTTVDGVTLDDDQYWAFYIDGSYATTGVDQTEVTAGASYELKAESM